MGPNMKRLLAYLICLPLVAATQSSGEPTGNSADWLDVRDIFVERCVMCHSAHGAAKGLRLDTYEAAIAGSITGAVLLRGNADGSELVRRIKGESTPRMPFLSTPLPDGQIELITRWVNEGLLVAD